MMRFAKLNPRPQPLDFVVNPGSKTRRATDLAIPFPLSSTSTWTSSPSQAARTASAPSPSMASTAFRSKFSNTQLNSGRLSRISPWGSPDSRDNDTFLLMRGRM